MHKEYDFDTAQRAREIPHLARLQDETTGKSRITIMLDNLVIEAFRELARAEGVGYQTLINKALRECLSNEQLTEESMRRVLREELGTYLKA